MNKRPMALYSSLSLQLLLDHVMRVFYPIDCTALLWTILPAYAYLVSTDLKSSGRMPVCSIAKRLSKVLFLSQFYPLLAK